MRAFVFFLILANLLFLAWTQGYLGLSTNPDALRVQSQLLAEKVKVIARDEPPPTRAEIEKERAAEAAKSQDGCWQLVDLHAAEAGQVERLLSERGEGFKAVRAATSPGSVSYWVYIPPLSSKKEAEAKVSELKKLQIADHFIVQEDGPNNYAISLGLFSSREAADSYFQVLRGKGVKSAKIAERNVKPALFRLEMRGPQSQFDAVQTALAEKMPELKLETCATEERASP